MDRKDQGHQSQEKWGSSLSRGMALHHFTYLKPTELLYIVFILRDSLLVFCYWSPKNLTMIYPEVSPSIINF